MVINVYFDSKGEFLTRLVGGSQKGIDVGEWMKSLYKSTLHQDGSYHPDAIKVTTNKVDDTFPCIIVIHKSLFRLWMKPLNKRLNMIEKVLKIFINLTNAQQQQGLWPTYKSYLDGEKSRLEKLKNVVDNHQKKLEQHLQQQCSYFNNYSIWIRLVDWKQSEIIKAMNEMEYFDKIGLYNYGSAKENREYNIRLQRQNYLDTTAAGHGVYVTPMLYGDESEHWKILFEDNKLKESTHEVGK